MADPDGETGRLIRKWALQNAVFHGGMAERGAILGKLISEEPRLKKEISVLIPHIDSAINEVNALSLEEQKEQLATIAPEHAREIGAIPLSASMRHR
jgi:glutamyl-tRNA synthetase